VYKLVTAVFINTALVVLIANRVALDADARFPDSPVYRWRIFGASGTTGNMIIVMIIDVFVDALILFFDPRYLLRSFRRFRVQRLLNAGSGNVLQCEANEVFEGEPYEVADFYFVSFKTFTVAYFYQTVIPYGLALGAIELYQTVIPYGLALGAIELFIKYWLIKYVSVRRARKPIDTNVEFSLNMIKAFELVIACLVGGFLVFKVILGDWGVFSRPMVIVVAAIGGYELIFGIKALRGCYENQTVARKTDRLRSFQDNERDFPYDYDRMNPISMGRAYKEYVNRIKYGWKESVPADKDPDLPYTMLNGIHEFAVRRNNQLGKARIYGPDIPLGTEIDEPDLYESLQDTPQLQNVNIYGIQDLNKTWIFANRPPQETERERRGPNDLDPAAGVQPIYQSTEIVDRRLDPGRFVYPNFYDRERDRIDFLASWLPQERKPEGRKSGPDPLNPIPFSRPNLDVEVEYRNPEQERRDMPGIWGAPGYTQPLRTPTSDNRGLFMSPIQPRGHPGAREPINPNPQFHTFQANSSDPFFEMVPVARPTTEQLDNRGLYPPPGPPPARRRQN
jgi:hypothetical protein